MFARAEGTRTLHLVRGGKFSDAEMRAIDVAYRGNAFVRCPLDEKPLLTTTWGDPPRKMVYFVCRACSRIGAVSYESSDPNVAGTPARESRPSRPPPAR